MGAIQRFFSPPRRVSAGLTKLVVPERALQADGVGVYGRLQRALLALAVAFIAGGAAAQVGEVNCDVSVDGGGREGLALRLYNGASCAADDANRDGRVNAADLIAMVHGPRISFLGVTSPDGRVARPLGVLPGGETVYFLNGGLGFNIVVEAASGPSGAPIGLTVLDHHPADPSRRGDFQAQVDRNLGDGAAAVCELSRGVPAVAPESFAFEQRISNSINDLSCRFAVATTPNSTCTQNEFGQNGFVLAGSRVQYCMRVNGFVAFPNGDTRVSVQVRDVNGVLSPVRRFIISVGSGPPPPTFSPTPSPTPTEIATSTPIPTATSIPTASRTSTQTRTPTSTRVDTPVHTPTPLQPTATRTRTLPPGTATLTATRTPTLTATRTPTRTHTLMPGAPTHTPTRTFTITATQTRTRTPTRTRTQTHTAPPGTSTQTPTATRTQTATRTPSTTAPPATVTRTPTHTLTPSPTSSVPTGPMITYFGLVTASDMIIAPSGEFVDGVPVYTRPFGSGFSIVVEAAPGIAMRPVARSTYNLSGSADLQIQVTRPLGNGSVEVCDNDPPLVGGVPAINPPMFSSEQGIAGVMNDLSCRFVDGQNQTVGRNCNGDPCIMRPNGQFGCAGAESLTQFCGLISQNLSFRSGDTLVSVRVRDTQGNFGPVSQIIVRIP